MTTDDEHRQEIREQLLPYALRELGPDDRMRVEEALDGDPTLRRELEDVEAAGARLMASVPHVPAPASLKGRVLSAVSAGADRPDLAKSPAVVPITQARSAWRGQIAPFGIAGLAAACIALALVSFGLDRDRDSERARADRLEQQAGEERASGGFLGVSSRELTTSGSMQSATGSLIRVSEDKWILLLRGVPAPGVGRSWQIWTADSRGQIRNVAQWLDGGDTRVVVLDRSDIKQVMVSLEPTTRPAPVPSSDPVVNINV